MLGAIIGDIVGSPYELTCNNIKTTDFPLFQKSSHFTDDTVMTVAVAEAMMRGSGDAAKTSQELAAALLKYGYRYPDAGYGGMFHAWLAGPQQPYGSYGNGSAMRVSSVAWLFEDLETVERFARISAEVTHNHPEGIKGAQATAAAIFMARRGKSKVEIRRHVEETCGYDLSSRTPETIRPHYARAESCQGTVPEALISFLHSDSFENAIRIAVSLGGDSDTLAAITGSVAEAAYGIPESIRQEALQRLDSPLLQVYEAVVDKIKMSAA